MRHILFGESEQYPVAILIKNSCFKETEIKRYYVDRLAPEIPADDIIACDLAYSRANKAPNSLIKEHLAEVMPVLEGIGTKYLYVCDANYFKVLTKKPKAEAQAGYVVPCKLEGYEHMQVVFGVNYQQMVYNPDVETRLDLTLSTMRNTYDGTYRELGEDVLKTALYPKSYAEIERVLEELLDAPHISADIETFSLHFKDAGIGSIGFGISQHDGTAFLCDYSPFLMQNSDGLYGEYVVNHPVRQLIKSFFERYQGRVIWHNATFDLRTLIYVLWMEHPLDTKGLLEGLEVMTRCFGDTKIIAYLATNSTAGNKLSLKDLAHAHAGNYAQEEIKDIRRIPPGELLEYNLVDTVATNYVYDMYHPKMVEDQQEELYHSLMLPSLKVIIQMELTGMPMDQDKVAYAREDLESQEAKYLATIRGHSVVRAFNGVLRQQEMDKANAKLKTKVKPIEDFAHIEFNPHSGPQLQQLLYEVMGLPVLDTTKSRQPATGGDTLKKLLNHVTNAKDQALIEAFIGLTGVSKILSAFIPSFEKAMPKADGLTYLHGSFNLGGTVSGRLSSSKPNLQQIPSGSEHAKVIKDCFRAPDGWLFCGADFNSLEDYISALTTKDPAKLDVYLKGYDGHCLRAYSYFPDRLPGIENTVDSINSIKKKFPDVRQASKGPTFSLTYGGTWMTLVKNEGFDETTAKKIEKSYHELYRVSDAWVQSKLDEAAKAGYVEVAFGLRVRTPLLARTFRNHRTTPKEAEAEGRTAGNALGQSYGLLNNRACNAFMKKVWASPFRHDILPVAQIHDAIYLMIRDSLDVVEFVNNNLIDEMRWQELPDIQHEEVKIGAELDIFWPSWAHSVTIPNEASKQTIYDTCVTHYREALPYQ